MKQFFRLSVVLSGMLLLSACNNAPADPEGDKNATNPNEGNDTTGDVAYFCKKTGQIKSYDGYGNEVTDGSIKDDGYYQTGITQAYTRDDTKEIVTDNVTGLQWQYNVAVKTVTKNWSDAKTYCDNLTFGDHVDWRLPNRTELVSLSDYGRRDPAIDPIFTNVVSQNYWSSTAYAGGGDFAWGINFSSGSQSVYYHKSDSYYVRCVRATQ